MLVIPGRPTLASLTFWILSERKDPPTASVPGISAAQVLVRSLRCADDPITGRLFLVAVNDLQPDTQYTLNVSSGEERGSAWSRTLPASLSNAPFTLAFGSCYCVANDTGIAAAYPPKLHDATSADPIRLRILGGDQIYMDLTPASGSPIFVTAPKPFERYLEQWQRPGFAAFLQKSPNIVLADDHEYWNDYPHGNVWQLWAESRPAGPLGERMDRAFTVFQSALNLDAAHVRANSAATNSSSALDGSRLERLLQLSARNFGFFVDPLSFYILDVRTRRSRYDAGDATRMCPSNYLDEVEKWVGELAGPGVLVVSQPMVEKRAGGFSRVFHVMGDVNLPDYDRDYARLWELLFSARHDVLVLTGDIHWSRSYLVTRPAQARNRVWELTSSPLSRIPGGAAQTDPTTGKVEWRGGNATYNAHYVKSIASTYTTLSFSRQGAAVLAQARVWETPSQRGQGPTQVAEHQLRLE